ncbi:YafY family protein [Phycicoccus sp. DTK01]|uniref:helix-turn-helix transcriptional regulator n=1 Tax=Phycicoccus sp. DTK01 TaxID=2785745 RepID=UPI001A8C2376|nr:WYL domain-containing protein [Phycicoccus sp. DTK01]
MADAEDGRAGGARRPGRSGTASASTLELLLESLPGDSAPALDAAEPSGATHVSARKEPAVARLLRLLRGLAAAGPRGLDGPYLLGLAGYDTGSPKSAMASLQRDVRRLEDAGWRIDNVSAEGSTGRYVLHPNDLASRAGLTAGEQSVLEEALAAHGAQSRGEPSDDVPSAFGAVRRAIDRRCVVEMTYNDTLRRVHPIRLTHPPGRWLLRARDEHDQVVKWFLLHKIEVVSLDEPGTAEAGVDDAADSLNPHHWRVDAPQDVQLLVAEEHVPFVRRSLGLSVSETPDGDRVLLTVRVTNRRALTDWLVTMGERVLLSGPEDVRREFLARLEAVARG